MEFTCSIFNKMLTNMRCMLIDIFHLFHDNLPMNSPSWWLTIMLCTELTEEPIWKNNWSEETEIERTIIVVFRMRNKKNAWKFGQKKFIFRIEFPTFSQRKKNL